MLKVETIKDLSDEQLRLALRSLSAELRVGEVTLARHLIEAIRRRLYALVGYSSAFNYCVEELHFSEATAWRRVTVANVLDLYPEAEEYLLDGRLHLTGLATLAKYLTADNHLELLERAAGLSKRGLSWLIAELAPREDTPSSIRKERQGSSSERGGAEDLAQPAGGLFDRRNGVSGVSSVSSVSGVGTSKAEAATVQNNTNAGCSTPAGEARPTEKTRPLGGCEPSINQTRAATQKRFDGDPFVSRPHRRQIFGG